MLYQNKTFGFNVFSNSFLKERSEYFLWIIAGLPISFLENEIREFKPKYLFVETTCMREINLVSDDYQVDFFNEIVIILKLKHLDSIKKYFIDN